MSRVTCNLFLDFGQASMYYQHVLYVLGDTSTQEAGILVDLSYLCALIG